MPSENPTQSFEPYQSDGNEEYMSDAQRAHFGKLLSSWQQELQDEIDRTVHRMQDEAVNYADPTDRATQESEITLELRTRDREQKLIRKIEKSLATLEENDYGFCGSCGSEIGIRRLEARPTAELCIDCKALAEIKEKQLAG